MVELGILLGRSDVDSQGLAARSPENSDSPSQHLWTQMQEACPVSVDQPSQRVYTEGSDIVGCIQLNTLD